MTLEEIKKDVKYWQRLLRLAGYYDGRIDGIRGRLQAAAEAAWEQAAVQSALKHGALDRRTEGNLATVLPELQDTLRAWLTSPAVKGWKDRNKIEVKIIQGTRSYREQDALYAKGRTVSGPKVTNARGGFSNHNFGVAVDLGLFRADGAYIGRDKEYKDLIAEAGIPARCIWGGSWKSLPDTPHIQLAKYGSTTSTIRDIFNR